MWNVMKAQNYQMRGDNIVVYGFLASLVIMLAGVFFDADADTISSLSGGIFAINCTSILPVILGMLTLVLSTRCMGWDMNDKTVNYEVLSGHSRKEVYWGRALSSLVWSLIGGVVIAVIPVLFVTVIKGWGANVRFGEMASVYLLIFFPVFRLVCEYILITVLLRNSNKGLVIGFLLFDCSIMADMIMYELLDIKVNALFSVGNILRITEVGNYKMQMVGGEEIQVYDFVPGAYLTIATVITSLVVGVLCLFIGYMVFKRHDMD